jgi:hypothetical protein
MLTRNFSRICEHDKGGKQAMINYPPVDYLDEKDILNKIVSARTPVSRTVTGYGSKLPTKYMLQIKQLVYILGSPHYIKRWHRVYVICYSNVGSAYVLVRGKRKFLSDTLL